MNGSYIAFADGHVGWFSIDFYPNQVNTTAAKCWDSDTQQWYNNNVTKDIIITP